jgi:thiamine biosynthesis lipoprotein
MLLAIGTLLVTVACNAESSFRKIQRTEALMDTFFTITVYSDRPQEAAVAIESAFDKVNEIASELNVYNDGSELSALNRDKSLDSPSEDFRINLDRALYFSNLSGGAFDISVQPILDLYTRAFSETNSPPSAEKIQGELLKVDYKKIGINESGITIGDNQCITLGGIAKGYAVDAAVEILKEHRINMALVNGGGNIRALGQNPDGVWHIAMADPRDLSGVIAVIAMDDNAVSTSGDYERYFDDSMAYHHIIDPETGYSATELISATIVADSAFDADALSTAVFVLGKEKGMALIESLPDVQGLIITNEKEIFRSSGFDGIAADCDVCEFHRRSEQTEGTGASARER